MTDREKYFIEVQIKERECLRNLYDNYFVNKGCTNLYTTPLTGYSRYDGTLKSGTTDVVIEYKRRNILTTKYSDTFIEKGKFKELYRKHKEGNYILFILEYDDFYMMFDLSYHFRLYDCEFNDYTFFYEINATADMYEYENGQKEKDIRCLNYYDCMTILSKEFELYNYSSYLEYRKNYKSTMEIIVELQDVLRLQKEIQSIFPEQKIEFEYDKITGRLRFRPYGNDRLLEVSKMISREFSAHKNIITTL